MLSIEHLEVLAERMPGGKCVSGFKLVGNMCVTIDPDAYEAKFIGPAPCASGQTESDGACFECGAGKKLDGFLCTSHDSTPNTGGSSGPATPKCPAGYMYAGGSNSCMPNGGGEFICPSGSTKYISRNGERGCLDNERVQAAVSSGQITIEAPPPASAPPPNSQPTAPPNANIATPQPTGVPSCGMESFASF